MRHMQAYSWKRLVLSLVLFGTAFGYLEAAVVSYLRYLHEPVRQRFYPGRPAGELFPLLTPKQTATAGPQGHKLLITEVGREAATIVMLAAVAMAASANLSQWAAAFVIAFGVWDITFYVFLKVLLNWPASLLTWDILFIIPVPWVGPVIAPVLVSAAMIAAGVWQLRCEAMDNPVRIGGRNWAGIVGGATIIILSFTLDSGNIASGDMPRTFEWLVFGSGITMGLAAYGSAAAMGAKRRSGARSPERAVGHASPTPRRRRSRPSCQSRSNA